MDEKFMKSQNECGYHVMLKSQISQKIISKNETRNEYEFEFKLTVNVLNKSTNFSAEHCYFMKLTYDEKQKYAVADFVIIDEKKLTGINDLIDNVDEFHLIPVIGVEYLLDKCRQTINTPEKKLRIKFRGNCFDDGKTKPSQAFLDYFMLSPIIRQNLMCLFREKAKNNYNYQSFFHDDEEIITSYEVIVTFLK